jgi:hypothetical protein
VQVIILGVCDQCYLTRDFADVIKDLEVGRLSQCIRSN